MNGIASTILLMEQYNCIPQTLCTTDVWTRKVTILLTLHNECVAMMKSSYWKDQFYCCFHEQGWHFQLAKQALRHVVLMSRQVEIKWRVCVHSQSTKEINFRIHNILHSIHERQFLGWLIQCALANQEHSTGAMGFNNIHIVSSHKTCIPDSMIKTSYLLIWLEV